jgi:hypothetical protein
VFKETVSQDFLVQVFFMIIFPQAPENNMGIISNFSKICEIFASQGAPLVSSTPGANWPPVSTTPTVNFAAGTAGVIGTK